MLPVRSRLLLIALVLIVTYSSFWVSASEDR